VSLLTTLIKRVSPVMPAPTLDSVGRPVQPWAPSSTTVADLGRLRLLVSNVDVTFFRFVPFELVSLDDAEPFGDATAVFEFPQITPFDTLGSGALSWLTRFAPVLLQLVAADDSTVLDTLWVGQAASIDRTDGGGQSGLQLSCTGSLMQAQLAQHQPPFFIDTPVDVGQMIANVLNGTVSRRFATVTAVTTGVTTRTKGDRSQTRLAYVQSLLATATDAAGHIWTVGQNAGTAVFQIRAKDLTTVDATFTIGTPGLVVQLTEDDTQAPNVIYGEWTTPEMCRGRNSKYPNIRPDDAPLYPNSNPAHLITVGTTDAATDSGHGVTDWQNQMHAIGYGAVLPTGTYSSSDEVYCKREQTAAGITVDGIIGPQTWAATFGVGSNSGDLAGAYFAPIAEDPTVEPFLYAANGATTGPNPAYVPGKMRVERFESLGDGLSRDQAFASAAAELAANTSAGVTGKIVATVDPEEGSRLLLRSGQNILLKGYNGGNVMLHIVARSVDANMQVTYTVDSKARDSLTVAQSLNRDYETTQDPAKQYRKASTALTTPTHAVWDCEAGSGKIPRHAVFGGLWTVIRVPVAEFGQIARTIFQTDTQLTEFAVFVFENAVTAADLVRYVGNPLGADGAWKNATTKDPLFNLGLRMAWGSASQPCGYSPLSLTDGAPLTGLLDDDAGWSYVCSKPPWLWVAEYATDSCFITGTLEQAVS